MAENSQNYIKYTVFEPVGRCIYCGSIPDNFKKLGKEHILALSLGGTTILPRASCTHCSAITRDFEQTCARAIFGNARLAADFPTRNPDERPKTLRIHGKVDGKDAHIDVPVEQYPISGCLPELIGPGLLGHLPSTTGFRVRLRLFHFEKERPIPKPGEPALVPTFSTPFQITPFVKMLAKVAHSLAVGVYGYDSHEWLLPDLIVGNSLNHPDYIGSNTQFEDLQNPFLRPPNGEEKMLWSPTTTFSCQEAIALNGDRYLSVFIQLFFDFSPKYLVLVARSNPKISYS